MTQMPTRLGVEDEGVWGFIAELGQAAIAAARELGMDAEPVSTADEEAHVDVLLTIGSFNLYPGLVGRPRATRRVLWHVEPLPRKTRERGDRLHSSLPTGWLLDLGRKALPAVAGSAAWRRWREQAANVREPKNNLAWLRRHARSVDRIVIDTPARAEGALDAGFGFDIVPFGYHPAYAGPLSTDGTGRDIAVLSMANVDRVARRYRLLTPIADILRQSNIELVQMPGHTYGEGRRRLLERSRIVLDVHRLPDSHPLFRFILSAAAGAAMISEPLAQPAPLVPGVHYVEAATADMARAARELLADEPRRLRMVEAAQELLTTDLDLRRTLPRALG